MSEKDDIRLSVGKEKELQRKIWDEVIKQNFALQKKYGISDKEETNIEKLEEITLLSREKIEKIAQQFRKEFMKKARAEKKKS
jgi:hypothetical protein